MRRKRPGRAHVYRALLEGQAYAMRKGRGRIERATKRRIDTLRIAGAASRSDLVIQIMADVLGLPAARLATHEASGLGAAIDAAVGIDWHADVDAAAAAMAHVGRVFEPTAAATRTYDPIYRDVYRPLARRLAPLNAALARLAARRDC